GRLVGEPVAAQVGHDDPEPVLGQGRHLVPPQPPRVGEAVQQHDRAPLPGHLVLDTDPIDIHPAHGPQPTLCPAGLGRPTWSRSVVPAYSVRAISRFCRIGTTWSTNAAS